MEVGMEQVTLKEVTVVALCICSTRPSVWIVDEFAALPHLASERYVLILTAITAVQWNVLDRVPAVSAAAGVFEVTVVLFITQELVCRRGTFVL
jgi:hypothetical protein